MTLQKDGHPINSLDDWFAFSPPKSKGHWVEGRSAMELARAWIGGSMPTEVAALLTAHPEFGAVLKWSGEPEARQAFDTFRGEPRNADLCVTGTDAAGDYLLAVEGKADESFGKTIGEMLEDALEMKVRKPASKALERIVQLSQRLFHPSGREVPPLAAMRYQLLTATAGALSEAQRLGLTRVVVLVHEFVTTKTKDEKHHANDEDYARFLRRYELAPIDGSLVGPVTLPIREDGYAARLFFAKVVSRLR